jgi:type I restriction enzyme S subunit
MKKGWEIKKLGEVCDFQGGSQPPKSNFIFEPRKGYVRFLQIRDFGSDKNITYIPESKKNRYCNENDILLGRYGASVGKVLVNKLGAYNVAVMKTIPNETVLFKRYLFFYLNTDDFQTRLLKTASRSAQDGFSKDDIFDFPILIPPLPEQQRIVAILDEAFAAMAKAKANAEQNLKNAIELFESFLQGVFEKKGDGWEEKTLGEMIEIKNGKNQQAVLSDTGKYKVMGSAGNVMGFATDFICEAGSTIIGRKGNISKPLYINERFWNVDTAFGFFPKNEKDIDKRFVYLLCLGIDFKSMNRGTTIPSLVKSELQTIKISFPKSLKEQQSIVQKLDALSAETKKLEAIYQQKINDLEELKKSVLQKAFSGELKTATALV